MCYLRVVNSTVQQDEESRKKIEKNNYVAIDLGVSKKG